jgi:hypothetical protein
MVVAEFLFIAFVVGMVTKAWMGFLGTFIVLYALYRFTRLSAVLALTLSLYWGFRGRLPRGHLGTHRGLPQALHSRTTGARLGFRRTARLRTTARSESCCGSRERGRLVRGDRRRIPRRLVLTSAALEPPSRQPAA